jgi:hypothetical protein
VFPILHSGHQFERPLTPTMTDTGASEVDNFEDTQEVLRRPQVVFSQGRQRPEVLIPGLPDHVTCQMASPYMETQQ